MDNTKIFRPNINYPLLKINDDNISDYVLINDKYKKYIIQKNDLVIGTKGTCGNIRYVNIEIGYHKHGLLKIINLKINKQYLYYIIKNKFDINFIKQNSNESVLSNMKKDKIVNSIVKVLTEKQMKKLKLQELFDEVDELKENLENNKKEYDKLLKELFKDFQENSDEELNISTTTKPFKLRKLTNNTQDLTDDETQSESEDIKEEVVVTQKTKKDKVNSISSDTSDSVNKANKVKKIKKINKSNK